MINGASPVWAISAYGAKVLEAGMADFVARIDAARVTSGRAFSNPAVSQIGSTAIIPIVGIMLRRESLWTRLGLAVSTETVVAAIDEAREDKRTQSIVLYLDSPGGEIGGLHTLVSAVKRANAEKPLFAQVDGECSSAAYWVASQARRVYAGPGDIVGGIGIRLMLFDSSKAYEKAGIEAVAIDSGPFKSAGAPGTVITKPQRAYFKELIDSHFADFLSDVKAGRGFTPNAAARISDGREFIAKQAIENHLIDGIQRIEDTIRAAWGHSFDVAAVRARMETREIRARAHARNEALN